MTFKYQTYLSHSGVMCLILTTNKTLNCAYWNDRTVLDHQTFEPKLKSTQLNIHSEYKIRYIMNRNSLIPNRHTTHNNNKKRHHQKPEI